MAKNLKITMKDLHNINISAVRKAQKTAGFFDGRFVARTEADKTNYTRKQKHKLNNY